jgi:S-adenosylmethionine synthetase
MRRCREPSDTYFLEKLSMSKELRLFTSESVTEGHPDKICDQISDSILDALLAEDRNSRVAVETLVTTGLVHVAGEVTTSGYVDIPGIVRKRITDIGYTSSDVWFDGRSCGVEISIGSQSPDIAQGVNSAQEAREENSTDADDAQGAGDQGIMFGYATTETPEYMPLPIWLAHRMAERLAEVRKSGQVDFLRPDGKTQVTIGYDGVVPRTVDTVVLSTQHSPKIEIEDLRRQMVELVIDPVLARVDLDSSAKKTFINPTGVFHIGGPQGDAGLTGRKIIVDTYGGASRHGGGAFSGKDPSKVDRSAAYAMRWVAKNAVAAGLADRLEVQVAYAIGKASPVGLYVETFGSGHVDDETIIKAIREVFDLRPASIIRELDLLRPIYAQTASYGHFGRELPDFGWEKLDRVDALRSAAKL